MYLLFYKWVTNSVADTDWSWYTNINNFMFMCINYMLFVFSMKLENFWTLETKFPFHYLYLKTFGV